MNTVLHCCGTGISEVGTDWTSVSNFGDEAFGKRRFVREAGDGITLRWI
jgi:hypothetical protein